MDDLPKAQLFTKIRNLSNEEIDELFNQLAHERRLSTKSILYNHFMELQRDYTYIQKRESQFASCLSFKYSNPQINKTTKFNDARAKILLDKWFPTEWLNKTFKHISKEELAEQKKYLEE